MQKYLTFFSLVIFIFLLIIFINFLSKSNQQNSKKPAKRFTVTTTLFPIYELTKKISGDKIEVVMLLPPGAEPHEFEPEPGDVRKVLQSNIVFYTSEYMEPWVASLQNQKSNEQNKVRYVDLSKNVNLLHEGKHTEDEHADGEENEGIDPHYWLDLTNSTKMIEKIQDELTKLDPANSKYFDNNAKALKNEISSLDKELAQMLAACGNKTVYHAGHFAFGYLAKRYDLDYKAVQGYSKESEVNASDIANFVKKIKDQNLKYIFVENLVDPKIAKTISQEVGVEFLTLHEGHNVTQEEIDSEISYISIMRANGKTIAKGLGCAGATNKK